MQRLQDCVAPASKRTYSSLLKSHFDRGYESDFDSLISFIVNRHPDSLRLSNVTVASLCSAWNTDLARRGEELTSVQLRMLKMARSMRKNLRPDVTAVKGAITAKRTEVFIQFLRDQQAAGTLDPEDCQLFIDAATMLYGCALRVGQLEALQGRSNFARRGEDTSDLFVSVPCKGYTKKVGDGKTGFEDKQVHPGYAARILDIVERRAKANTLLFATFPSRRTAFIDLVQVCAAMHKWPVQHRFATHGFRNGAAQDAYEESGGCLRFVMARTGHITEAMAQLYALSDLERDNRIGLQQMKRSDAARLVKNTIAESKNLARTHVRNGTVSRLKKGAVPPQARLPPAPVVTTTPATTSMSIEQLKMSDTFWQTLDSLSTEELLATTAFWRATNSKRFQDMLRAHAMGFRPTAVETTVRVGDDAASTLGLDDLQHPRYTMQEMAMMLQFGISVDE